ncbi:MAG: hypothetical protein LBE24_04215 [Methylobacillus sp.]|jgi:hypothetical protein|nr:hypothetical protein [Methylobacillus sp.]
MKVALATKKDINALSKVCQILSGLHQGYMPSDKDGDDEPERFYDDEPELCQRALNALLLEDRRGSLLRALANLFALLDPDNKIVDPDSDTLETHPKINQACACQAALEHELSVMHRTLDDYQSAADALKALIAWHVDVERELSRE